MIALTLTTSSLEVVLTGAITTNQLDCSCHAVDLQTSDQSVSAVVNTNITSNSTTAVTVMAAPASGHTRAVKSLTVYNKDTVAAEVTVRINANGTFYILTKTTLAIGETLVYSADD